MNRETRKSLVACLLVGAALAGLVALIGIGLYSRDVEAYSYATQEEDAQ